MEINKTNPLIKKEGIGEGGSSGKRSIIYKIKETLQTFKIKIIG